MIEIKQSRYEEVITRRKYPREKFGEEEKRVTVVVVVERWKRNENEEMKKTEYENDFAHMSLAWYERKKF